MDDKRKIERTICNRKVSFSINESIYHGTIENISNDGTLILTDAPMPLQADQEIILTITTADQGDLRKARVVWSEGGAFGAKFL